VPTHVIAARDDRLFPLTFMHRQAHHRLGVTPDVIPGGHYAALTQSSALTHLLMQYQRDATAPQ
jgi:pimeloyl-ACP methyl ester carboxylesterase